MYPDEATPICKSVAKMVPEVESYCWNVVIRMWCNLCQSLHNQQCFTRSCHSNTQTVDTSWDFKLLIWEPASSTENSKNTQSPFKLHNPQITLDLIWQIIHKLRAELHFSQITGITWAICAAIFIRRISTQDPPYRSQETRDCVQIDNKCLHNRRLAHKDYVKNMQ